MTREKTARRSIEQVCRDLLEFAIQDGLVKLNPDNYDDPHPQSRTAGDLCGMANMLRDYLIEIAQQEK